MHRVRAFSIGRDGKDGGCQFLQSEVRSYKFLNDVQMATDGITTSVKTPVTMFVRMPQNLKSARLYQQPITKLTTGIVSLVLRASNFINFDHTQIRKGVSPP